MWVQGINAKKVAEGVSKRHIDQLVVEKRSLLTINGEEIGNFYLTGQLEKEWGVGYSIIEKQLNPKTIEVKYENGVIAVIGDIVDSMDVFMASSEIVVPKAQDIYQLTGYFQQAALLYKKTSVTESVGLGLNNVLHHCCEDILIENAFYKAIGSYVCTHKSLPLNQYLLVSSKLDLRFMTMALASGVGLIISRTAPTKQALDKALAAQVGVLGFARGRKYIVYA